jgi:hypothetical protein
MAAYGSTKLRLLTAIRCTVSVCTPSIPYFCSRKCHDTSPRKTTATLDMTPLPSVSGQSCIPRWPWSLCYLASATHVLVLLRRWYMQRRMVLKESAENSRYTHSCTIHHFKTHTDSLHLTGTADDSFMAVISGWCAIFAWPLYPRARSMLYRQTSYISLPVSLHFTQRHVIRCQVTIIRWQLIAQVLARSGRTTSRRIYCSPTKRRRISSTLIRLGTPRSHDAEVYQGNRGTNFADWCPV